MQCKPAFLLDSGVVHSVYTTVASVVVKGPRTDVGLPSVPRLFVTFANYLPVEWDGPSEFIESGGAMVYSSAWPRRVLSLLSGY